MIHLRKVIMPAGGQNGGQVVFKAYHLSGDGLRIGAGAVSSSASGAAGRLLPAGPAPS